MPNLNTRVALISENSHFYKKFDTDLVEHCRTVESLAQLQKKDLLIFDYNFINKYHLTSKPNIDHKRSIAFFEADATFSHFDIYNQLQIQRTMAAKDMTMATVMELLAEIDQEQQDQSLLKIASDLNSEYENIRTELENKISQKQIEINERRLKILDANNKIESIRKILYAISSESDTARIETRLNELVPMTTATTWVKIIPENLIAAFEKDLSAQIKNHYHSKMCHKYKVYFVKGDAKVFKKSDLDFFEKITDALHFNFLKSDSVENLYRIEQIVTTAFNATEHPLMVVDKNFNIHESNKAFRQYESKNNKCYEALFNRTEPCVDCQFGERFDVENQNKYYSIQSEPLDRINDAPLNWVHYYTNITEEKLIEQRMTQTAKMKELGLISSSIAHELNNPLGGIISYLQIMQMDLAKDHDLQKDLATMLTAALRMKSIIENLLVFSRKSPHLTEKKLIAFDQIFLDIVQMNQLQTKAENIKVVYDQTVLEQFKALIVYEQIFKDSMNLIFGFFVELIKKQKNFKSQFIGLIEAKFSQDQINFYLEFQSNCGPLDDEQKNKNIFFLMIHKSLVDQGFQVYLTEPHTGWVAIKVLIPKQDFPLQAGSLKS